MTGPTVVDLFAGPGGWDEGARLLGFSDEILGVENEANACATAQAAGHARLNADIAAIEPRDVISHAVGLIGSPPCPGFSSAGKGLGRLDLAMLTHAIKRLAYGDDPWCVLTDVRAEQRDKRSALTLEPLRWALALRPEWIALEQVPSVLPLWQAYADALRSLGYDVWTGYLHAEQYAVAQTRKRAGLIASRTRSVAMPTPTHSRYYPHNPSKVDDGVPRWVSMAEALGHGMTERPSMTITGGGTSTGGAEPFGNAARQGMKREAEAGRWQFAGAGATARYTVGQVPRDLDQPAHTLTGKGTAYWTPTAAIEGEDGVDIVWPYDRPSPTIVGSFAPDVVAAPGYRKAGDPPRQKTPGSVRVTVTEAAILQSFRADYPWQGKSGAQYQQVGNAVPPLLAAHVLAVLTGQQVTR